MRRCECWRDIGTRLWRRATGRRERVPSRAFLRPRFRPPLLQGCPIGVHRTGLRPNVESPSGRFSGRPAGGFGRDHQSLRFHAVMLGQPINGSRVEDRESAGRRDAWIVELPDVARNHEQFDVIGLDAVFCLQCLLRP